MASLQLKVSPILVKEDTYVDLRNEMIFAMGVTEKYVLYAVKNEMQMRSVNYVSPEDRNDQGDAITKIKSKILNVTEIDCFRKTNTCVVSGNNRIEVYLLSSIGINYLSSFAFTEFGSGVQFAKLAAI